MFIKSKHYEALVCKEESRLLQDGTVEYEITK